MRNAIAPRGGGKVRRFCGAGSGGRVEDVAQTRDRHLHLLKILPQLRQPQDRLHHLARDHVEGDEFADRHRPFHHRLRADKQDQRGRDLAHVLDEVLPERARNAGVERGAHVSREPLLPLRLHHRLDARGLEGLRADDRFDQELLRPGAAVELLVDLLAQHRPDETGDDDIDRDRSEHDQSELHRIDEHHHEEDQREDEIEQRGQPLPGQKAADRLELAHASHRLPGRAGLEIGERQPEEMMEQAPAELDVHPVGGVAQRIGAQELQDGLEQAERHHADDQHDQRREAFVNQHLVDDELEEDRRRQREQLHEQRRDQHMGERAPIAHDRGPEPAEPEGVGIDARAREPSRDQHHLARGQRRDVLRRQLLRRPGDRIDQPRHSLGRARAQDSETALLQPQDRRIGNGAETLGGHTAKHARLQLKNIRAANNILSLRATAGQGELMPQLRRIGGDTVISGDQRKPAQSRIYRLRRCGDPISPLPIAVVYLTYIVISNAEATKIFPTRIRRCRQHNCRARTSSSLRSRRRERCRQSPHSPPAARRG